MCRNSSWSIDTNDIPILIPLPFKHFIQLRLATRIVHKTSVTIRVFSSPESNFPRFHFSNFFRYAETAERDLFEAAKVDLIHTRPEENAGWPRAQVECKFSAPLRFGDTIEIHLAVKALKDRSIDYQFRIFRQNPDGSRTQAAKGQMVTVLVRLTEKGELESIELPDSLRERIAEAPPEALARPKDVR